LLSFEKDNIQRGRKPKPKTNMGDNLDHSTPEFKQEMNIDKDESFKLWSVAMQQELAVLEKLSFFELTARSLNMCVLPSC
jgi:hypothetical protein